MAKAPTLSDITNTLTSATTINANSDRIVEAFENTLSLDGSTPNAMLADLDMNGHDLLNIKDVYLTGDVVQVAVKQGFTSRSAFVSWSALAVITDGAEVTAAGYRYMKQVGATTIPDLLNWIPVGQWTPFHFGAVGNGVANDTIAFTNLHNAINASSVPSVDVTGIFSVNGLLPAITRSNFWYGASGYNKFIRTSAGAIIRFTGGYITSWNLEFDGGGFTSACVSFSGAFPRIFFNRAYNTLGQGISIADNVDNPLIAFSEAHDTGQGGIGIGKTFYPFTIGCRVWNTGAEGIPGDLQYGGVTVMNYAKNAGGVGGFGTDGAENSVWIGNVAIESNNGFVVVDHRNPGSDNLAFIGNIAVKNDKTGFKIKNDYHDFKITGITSASPAVVTFGGASISGATKANPCVITATAHGLDDNSWIKIHSVNGMTELNNNDYRIKVINANSFALKHFETGTFIDSTTYTTYTSGGSAHHAFEATDRVHFSGVVGMTGINGLECRVRSKTNTTITLENEDGTDFNTTTFGTYTSGGKAYAGDSAVRVALLGNISTGNNTLWVNGVDPLSSAYKDIQVEGRLPQAAPAGHTILGNQSDQSTESYDYSLGTSVINRPVSFLAELSSGGANVTGNNTAYTVLGAQVYDTGPSYNAGTGVWTAVRSGYFMFHGAAAVTNMASATSAIVALRVLDPLGNLIQEVPSNLVPDGGVNTAVSWRGETRAVRYLEKGSTVRLRVTVNGLGADTADMINASFSGHAVG